MRADQTEVVVIIERDTVVEGARIVSTLAFSSAVLDTLIESLNIGHLKEIWVP